MTAEHLLELPDRQPFKPIRLHLADGRTREIRRRQMVLVAREWAVIGIPRDDRSNVAAKVTQCWLPGVVRVEVVD